MLAGLLLYDASALESARGPNGALFSPVRVFKIGNEDLDDRERQELHPTGAPQLQIARLHPSDDRWCAAAARPDRRLHAAPTAHASTAPRGRPGGSSPAKGRLKVSGKTSSRAPLMKVSRDCAASVTALIAAPNGKDMRPAAACHIDETTTVLDRNVGGAEQCQKAGNTDALVMSKSRRSRRRLLCGSTRLFSAASPNPSGATHLR